MNKLKNLRLALTRPGRAIAALSLALLASHAAAQSGASCTEITSGLLEPLGAALTPHGRLLVAETGPRVPNTGSISIVESNGSRRTLLAGLPSGVNDVGGMSGPGGLLLRGRTLYVAIGVGDVGVIGSDAAGLPVPGSAVPNPNGPSSPIFSSVLAVHFSAQVERSSKGFMLTTGDQQLLAAGQKVTLSNGGGDQVMVERVVDFPNYVPWPNPRVTQNIQMSNPFQLVASGDRLYVTDGGRNLVWRVDTDTQAFEPVANFPAIPNPLFGIPLGGPFLDAVPTGIAPFGEQLLVTLFRGAPFPPGSSTVQQVDPVTGTQTPFISGLKTAIDVIPVAAKGSTSFLVLQHASVGPFFGGPGQVLRFDSPSGPPTVVASCLTRPTTMLWDARAGKLYVTEVGGRLVSIALEQ